MSRHQTTGRASTIEREALGASCTAEARDYQLRGLSSGGDESIIVRTEWRRRALELQPIRALG
jgi:hypothetical protein